ncbi:hypothetical protein Pint_36699 [Pistacia integerrima]|uniref:Uncharacterized protein n=1 Tax=Pistacia integerrima TaxID=434235 RepID=A0ACC0XZN6_9ROSI|nr:hypothetical protein Pint_36699 [Pistacia integerrima]
MQLTIHNIQDLEYNCQLNWLAWGFGGFGALGHFVYHRGLFPRLVEGSWNGKIRHIATSGTHTAAIAELGCSS